MSVLWTREEEPAGSSPLECGHPESPHGDSTRGYGVDNEGRRCCYDCCQARDMETISQAQPFVGYLTKSDEGYWQISNWPGRRLLLVTRHWPLNNQWVKNGCMSDDLYAIQAVDSQGRTWYGRGMGEGMYCRMRPTKATKAAVRS